MKQINALRSEDKAIIIFAVKFEYSWYFWKCFFVSFSINSDCRLISAEKAHPNSIKPQFWVHFFILFNKSISQEILQNNYQSLNNQISFKYVFSHKYLSKALLRWKWCLFCIRSVCTLFTFLIRIWNNSLFSKMYNFIAGKNLLKRQMSLR